jgi:hypothetical protein
VKKHLRSHVSDIVALGESDFDEVVEAAIEFFDDEDEGGATEEMRHAAAREAAIIEFAAHADAQRAWETGPLDPDRLHAAFRALDAAGIIARADFTCCQTCGLAEIGAEIPEGDTRRGYTFCHRQDVEAAVHGRGIHLSYGSLADDTAPGEVAVEIIRTLTRHGFEPEWNADLYKRIFVPMTWRVRRHGRLAAYPGAMSGA